ncbi:MAG: septal ring lytic transglycosylase RlpA family protein [Oceanicaulis sp.]
MIKRAAPLALSLFGLAALSGCASEAEREAGDARPAARVFSPPVYEAIAPENDTPRVVETGLASWYGPGFHGNLTANGEIFSQHDMSAAHPSLPLPSLARVTRIDTGESVLVRINDRGPFVEGRVIDLSRAAADALGFIDDGVAEVRIEALGPADAADRAAPPEFFNPAERP